jgi:hypothetical protein
MTLGDPEEEEVGIVLGGGCWLTFTRAFEDVNASPAPAGIDGVRGHRLGCLVLQVGWRSCRQMG